MKRISVILGVLFLSQWALAIETPAVLPVGIRAAVVKTGSYKGLNEYYTESGNLKYLSDKNSFELSMENLSAINNEVNTLKQILNEYPGNLGNQLHLGKLTVDADPSVRYFAPAFAYGYNKKLTLGLAIPIIYFHNSVSVDQSGSNLDQIVSELGSTPQDLQDGIQRLENELTRGLNGALTDKGYKPLQDKDENYIGDIQLVSMYQISAKPELVQSVQTYLSLPTGPKPDPDDLTDLENFGRYSLKTSWITQQPFKKNVDFVTNASYLFIPKQNFVKRVPLNEEDVLPDQNQKYSLGEDLGDVVSLGAGLIYKLDDSIHLGSGYNYEYKFSDSYSGAPSGREKYLEEGTQKSAHLLHLEMGYSTVASYFKKKAVAPIVAAYQITKTLSGTNIENQTRHEVSVSLFF